MARMWRKKNTPSLLVGLVQPLWKSIWRFSRKLEIYLPEDPATSLFGIYPNDAPTFHRDTCSIMIIVALFVIARSWKQPRRPMTEKWIQKMQYIYTMEYYSAIKKNEFMKVLGKWMDLEGIALSDAILKSLVFILLQFHVFSKLYLISLYTKFLS